MTSPVSASVMRVGKSRQLMGRYCRYPGKCGPSFTTVIALVHREETAYVGFTPYKLGPNSVIPMLLGIVHDHRGYRSLGVLCLGLV